ncbi:MAG: autotransporter domain-containing protein [Parcubacteria group bacterium]
MKTSQPTIRRLALLATSSFGALGLIALTAAALTPTQALAADECGVQATDGDPIVCAPGTYPTGVTYTGDAVPVTVQDGVVVTNGGVNLTSTTSVSLTAQTVTANDGDLQVTNTAGAGLSLTGGSVNLNLTDADSGDAPGFITGTSGVVATGTGPINLNLGNLAITGTDANGYGVYAAGTGASGVTINATGDISSAGVGVVGQTQDGFLSIRLGDVSGSQTAVAGYATGNGGVFISVAGNVTGDIVAAASGSGGLFLQTGGSVAGNVTATTTSGQLNEYIMGAVSGDVVSTASNGGTIYANVGSVTGHVIVTADGGGSAYLNVGNITSTGIPVILTADTGDVLLGLQGQLTAGGGYSATVHAGGSAWISIGSGVSVSQDDFDISVGNRLIIQLGHGGTLIGGMDFSAAPGGGAFYNGAIWDAAPIVFTDAGDFVQNASDGVIRTQGSIIYDFKGGSDVVENYGTIIIGGISGPSTLTFTNLENINNDATIIFGSTDGVTSDGETNDRLAAASAHFDGNPYQDNALLMDVNVTGGNQADCSAAVLADCMSFVGGSTGDHTSTIYINDVGGSVGALNRIVLVDLHGGTSSPTAFKLSSATPIEKGMFFYRLEYDAANQQWVLAGYAGRSIYQFSEVATTAQNLWYDSAQAWTDLSADDRDQEGASGPAIWLKATKNDIDRTAEVSPVERDQIAPYNVGYSGDVKAYTGGVDILRGDGYVAGLMLGHQDADISHKASTNRTRLKGENYAAYGRWSGGRFFVDGIVQLSRLDLLQTGDWNTGGDVGKGKVKSTGAQVDAGARFPISDRGMTIEPLASLAYVTTKIDDLALPGAGGAVRYDDPKSLRGGLGARVSGSYSVAGGTLRMSATGRAWKEFEGDYKVAVLSAGNTLEFGDDFSGTFEELGVSVSYSLPNSGLSAFVNGNSKWKENYTDSSVALGVRMSW